MITRVRAGELTVRGVSVGGVYTALHVPELDLGLDVGLAPRSLAGVSTLCLSHAHVDHIGALSTLLGIRALHGQKKPLRVIMPKPIVADVQATLAAMTTLQHWPLVIEAVGVDAGDEVPLKTNRTIRAFATFHPVPSLGYQVVRTVQKLKPAFVDEPGPRIAQRRRAGEDIFDNHEVIDLAYATDTLIGALDHCPSTYQAQVLIMECTFLDEKKGRDVARAGCHIHLDEVIERADKFQNQHIVLMHFSQLYRPGEIAALLDRRVPPGLRARMIPFVPEHEDWPG